MSRCVSLERSKPDALDLDHAGAAALPSPGPTSSMLSAACVAFFVALSIYSAATQSPRRINHHVFDAFAWGREFQLGYAQHPPFWAWLRGTWFLAFPREISASCAVDDRPCLEGTAKFASPPSKPAGISLAPAAWGYIANAFRYIVTAIPPRG